MMQKPISYSTAAMLLGAFFVGVLGCSSSPPPAVDVSDAGGSDVGAPDVGVADAFATEPDARADGAAVKPDGSGVPSNCTGPLIGACTRTGPDGSECTNLYGAVYGPVANAAENCKKPINNQVGTFSAVCPDLWQGRCDACRNGVGLQVQYYNVSAAGLATAKVCPGGVWSSGN
jgi:hypothetical protein